tara:strand:+ start:1627 stop:1911 length:285 start_codon:yes stop_codon:yes gene_type:complete
MTTETEPTITEPTIIADHDEIHLRTIQWQGIDRDELISICRWHVYCTNTRVLDGENFTIFARAFSRAIANDAPATRYTCTVSPMKRTVEIKRLA